MIYHTYQNRVKNITRRFIFSLRDFAILPTTIIAQAIKYQRISQPIYNIYIMTTFEHREIRGITIKNMIVTIASTISIVVSVMTGYFQLKGDIKDIRSSQETQSRINEIRLKVLEGQVNVLQQEVRGLKDGKRS